MNRSEILENFRSYVDMRDEDLDSFFEYGTRIELRKKEVLVEQSDQECYLTYVLKGCLMTSFYDPKGTEHVVQFALPKWWASDLEAFSSDMKSKYRIRAMLPTEVIKFDKDSMGELCERHPIFEEYFRKIFQNALVGHQRRIVENFSLDAEEKYKAFRKRFPDLEHVIPKKYIAAYLGITPQFLSNIRRRMALIRR